MGPLLSLHKNKINLLFILEYSNVLRATYFVKTVKRIRPWFIAHSAGRGIIIILSILELFIYYHKIHNRLTVESILYLDY